MSLQFSGKPLVTTFCHTDTCCPGFTPLPTKDPKSLQLGVVIKNATPEETQALAEKGLSAEAGETVGTVPFKTLIQFVGQALCNAATQDATGQAPQQKLLSVVA